MNIKNYPKKYRNTKQKHSKLFLFSELKSKSHSTYTVGVMVSLLMIGLISSSSNVFAERPRSDFLDSTDCKIHFPPGASSGKVTGCWNDGGGETCQTCNWKEGVGYTTCDQPVIEMFEEPPTSSPQSPTHTPSTPGGGTLQVPKSSASDTTSLSNSGIKK